MAPAARVMVTSTAPGACGGTTTSMSPCERETIVACRPPTVMLGVSQTIGDGPTAHAMRPLPCRWTASPFNGTTFGTTSNGGAASRTTSAPPDRGGGAPPEGRPATEPAVRHDVVDAGRQRAEAHGVVDRPERGRKE